MRSVYLMVVTTLSIFSSSVAQTPAEWLGKETALWQAAKEKNRAPFEAAFDSAFVGVYADGLHQREAELAAVGQGDLREYQLSDFAVRQLGPQVVLLTYKAVVTGDASGIDFSGTYWLASVWQLQGSTWRAVMHSEVKAP
jgi:hypothetical protein